MSLLEVKGVNQYYGGSHILRNVSLTAELGQVTVVLGRNGVGKTTLLKSLMGLVPIKSGAITFDGKAIDKATPYEQARAGIDVLACGGGVSGPEVRPAERDLGHVRHGKRDISEQFAGRRIAPRAPTTEESDPDAPLGIDDSTVGVSIGRVDRYQHLARAERAVGADRMAPDVAGERVDMVEQRAVGARRRAVGDRAARSGGDRAAIIA